MFGVCAKNEYLNTTDVKYVDTILPAYLNVAAILDMVRLPCKLTQVNGDLCFIEVAEILA